MFLTIFGLIGCIEDDGSQQYSSLDNLFVDHLQRVTINPYKVSYQHSFASSGGGSGYNDTRELSAGFLKLIVRDLSGMKITGTVTVEDRTCFYGRINFTNYFLCFAEDRIVNYIQNEGPESTGWSAVDYPFDIGRSHFIRSADTLRNCLHASDCEITGYGIELPTGGCETRESGYTGCRSAMNQKYHNWWFLPFVEDACLPILACVDNWNNESIEVACVNSICELRTVSKNLS